MENDLEQKIEEKKVAPKKAVARKREADKAAAIDDLYKKDEDQKKTSQAVKKRLQSIDQPEKKKFNIEIDWKKWWRVGAVMVVVAVVVSGVIYWQNQKKNSANQLQSDIMEEKWYAIKLVNGELFFGLVADSKADPLVVKSVYYDYDRVKNGATSTEENGNGNLRLVKRGKESYGPEGTLNIVRAQVLYLEPLKESSKVLNAILENEK